MSEPGDVKTTFMVGTLPDEHYPHQVLLDFRAERLDHLKLTPETALQLAEALVEAARDVAQKRVNILLPGRPR
jgi:hypothetical protein